MGVEGVVEDFGNMPEFLKDGMRIKYQARDKKILEKFCKKYDKKLVMVCIADEPNYMLNTGFEPLYFFEGDATGHTRETLEISMQDTQVILN